MRKSMGLWSTGGAVAVLGLCPSLLAAQTVLTAPTLDKPMVMLEVIRPSFDESIGNLSAPSGAIFGSTRWPVSGRVHIVGEVPFSYGRLTDAGGGGQVSQAALGNPYAGIEYRFAGSPLYIETGIRAPLGTDSEFLPILVGVSSDLDRWEAFASDIVPITAVLNYTPQLASGWVVRLRGGGSSWISTGGDSELFAIANAQGGYTGRRYLVLAGGSSRALLTESGSFGELTAFQLDAGGWYEFGRVRPGLQFRLPVDSDLADVTNFSLGVSADVRLN